MAPHCWSAIRKCELPGYLWYKVLQAQGLYKCFWIKKKAWSSNDLFGWKIKSEMVRDEADEVSGKG